jgi:hypothetical protein
MATNMVLKRARKAQRRKQVVVQKRRAEVLEASLPARVLRAAHAPFNTASSPNPCSTLAWGRWFWRAAPRPITSR